MKRTRPKVQDILISGEIVMSLDREQIIAFAFDDFGIDTAKVWEEQDEHSNKMLVCDLYNNMHREDIDPARVYITKEHVNSDLPLDPEQTSNLIRKLHEYL